MLGMSLDSGCCKRPNVGDICLALLCFWLKAYTRFGSLTHAVQTPIKTSQQSRWRGATCIYASGINACRQLLLTIELHSRRLHVSIRLLQRTPNLAQFQYDLSTLPLLDGKICVL